MLAHCFLFKILIIALLVPAARASGPLIPEFALVEVADGVYVHPGRQVDLNHADRGDSANIGFIVGQRCVAVVDTGGSLATGRALLAAIRDHTQVPVCYVINTHVHFDHVLGNAAFVDQGAEIVGHENLVEAIAGNREFFLKHFAPELGGGPAQLVIAPTKTVSETMSLDLGERRILLKAHPSAHTNADLSVYDEHTRTLWTGDLVFIGRLPILDGSLRGWINWIEEYQAIPLARIVPGHGPTSANWPSGVVAVRDYLITLLTGARQAVNDGVYLEDAMATMSRNAALAWPLSESHSRNVSRAFRELEWE